MPKHRDTATRKRRSILAARLASLTVVLVAVAGLVAGGPLTTQTSARADTTPSAITVKWTGDTSTAAGYQPARSTSSPHYAGFKNLAITVSQTSGIIDQAVRVSVTGFAGTKSSQDFGTNAQNFLQVMQCWGLDPLAADFRQTCQWGGRVGANNGLGNSVYADNTLRVAAQDASAFNPTTTGDVPFKTVDGQTVSGKPTLVNGNVNWDLLSLFGPSTTNEVTSARVGADGTGYVDFETQSANQAPQLGCGTTGHLRCWIVVVPRGTVFGGNGAACSGILDPANNYDPYTYGRPNSVQGGSPLNPGCDYWDNRIAIPLDFTPVGTTCAVGSPEQRVVGSQLMVAAMSSWQPALCQSLSTTFSFSTNPDAIAREQVLDNSASSPNLGYVGFPVSSGDLSTSDERDLLAKTKFSYAPVAISSVVVAFIAEFDSGRQEQLVLSPRLLAKLLTQSYEFTVPWNTSDPAKNFAHLPAVNRSYGYFNQDPEFQALNPTNYNQFTSNPAIVLPGPAGADAIKQVWRWIQADHDAVSFLDGNPDPWGMTVNPYYLPKGDPNAVVPWWIDDQGNYTPTSTQKAVGLTNLDGTPQKLSQTSLDTFPKDDESLVPLNKTVERTRFDSIQYAPYTDSLLTGARQAFRANPNSKTTWDVTKVSTTGDVGDWVSTGSQLPGQKFMIAITDSPSALRYSLNTASLQLPNSAVVVAPTTVGMSTALSALTATSLDSVKQVDPAAVPAGGYPLTMVSYVAVNLSKTSSAVRSTLSSMITQVTTTGQVAGSATGQLPAGYLPLTTDLANQASAAATLVRTYTAATQTNSGSGNSGQYINTARDDYTPGSTDTQLGTLAVGSDPTQTTGVDAESTDRTQAAAAANPVQSGLAVSLGVGLAGFLFAPILFRGKGFL